MKKVLLTVLMSILICGVVSASSINGDYKGNPIVYVYSNGEYVASGEVPSFIYDGSTMVPISLLRRLGATITWNADKYTVDVKMPEAAVDKGISANDIARYYDRVGTVKAYDSNGFVAVTGSCVIVNEQGLIVTNYHVAGQATKLEVHVNNKNYTVNASDFVFSDSKEDLVGVYLDKNNKKGFPTLNINYSLPSVSDKIYAMGSPQGLEGTITSGEVNAVRYINNNQMAIQVNAQLDHGNSGGALFNNRGELIGIVSNALDNTKLGFAIPMSTVKTLMSK